MGVDQVRLPVWASALLFVVEILSGAPAQAQAAPKSDVAALVPLWRDNAPVCETHPSSQNCHDGDMTLFNGLLCAAGEAKGCAAVKAAQVRSGRWYRSPRRAANPGPDPRNTFSWDMALGVQLYAVTTGDKAALGRWLSWIEQARPCLSKAPFPLPGGKSMCLVRGWPRWCPDDTENGCMAKPNNLATLAKTVEALGVVVPPPAEDPIPNGLPSPVRKALEDLQEELREANATLSLQRLLNASRDLQPAALQIDAAVNREGYPRHLVGTEILLARRLGLGSRDVDLAAYVLALKEPNNPFFQYLAKGPTEEVAKLLLTRAPRDVASLPSERSDWAWQRAEEDQAWTRSNLWDAVFMGRLLTNP